MSDLFYVQDHTERAVGRLLSQYKRPNLEALISVFAERTQQIEDALWAQGPLTYLANASGQQLDNIAELVGVSRNGLTDWQLKALIKARIAQQTGTGTLPAMLDIAKGFFATDDVHIVSSNSFSYVPQRAAATIRVAIGSTELSASEIAIVAAYFSDALVAGVAIAQILKFESSGVFAFAGPQQWVRGFGVGSFATALQVNEAY